MKKIIGTILLLTILTVVVPAQKPAFSSTVQAGMLEGEAGTALQLKTVTGLHYKTWVAGLGVGLDYYHTRSLPLFLSLQKAVAKSGKSPFVYVSGGYHFPWLKPAGQTWQDMKAKGGLYLDAGIGYQLPAFKSTALFFTAGYSQKNFSETTTSAPVYIDMYPPPPVQATRYDFILRRLSVQTGLRF